MPGLDSSLSSPFEHIRILNCEGTAARLPVSLWLMLTSLTRSTVTIWWKILRIVTQHRFSYLGSQNRSRCEHQQQSHSVPHVVGFFFVADTTLLKAAFRRTDQASDFGQRNCVQRRWLPLSDGERNRGCTAAQRWITWLQPSGINTHTHARPHITHIQ